MTSSTPAAPSSDARILYLTREGCHLCEVALPLVRAEAVRAGAELEVRDIDEDPALVRDWNDDVPVVFVDGQLHARYEVDPARLRACLAPLPWWRRLLPRR
ncbi:glutaredoxin family protein [Brachybacterium hainanense]|uniref:Glutaredoxin family protein n=1 Tax=Brachybacterium hainanense TaxID=1541174 RepID=A0ABV6RGX9_9MICO